MSNIASMIDYPFFFGIFLSIIVIFTLFFRRLYNKSSFLQEKSSFLQIVLSITIFSIGLVFGFGLFFTKRVENIAHEKLEHETTLTCSFLKSSIDAELSKIDAATMSLQGAPWIIEFLQNPSAQTLQKANTVLDRYCYAFKTSVVYLMDTNGVTLASSNRNDPESFVNHDFSFRPYFLNALKGDHSSYFANGINTNIPGYYSSAPVKDSTGKNIGIITLKDGLAILDSIFSSVPFAFLSNSNGVILISSVPEYRFKSIYPIPDSLLEHYNSSRQFGTAPIQPLNLKFSSEDKIILNKKQYLVKQIPIQLSGWYVTLFYPQDLIFNTRLTGFSFILATLFCILITISLISLNRVKQWADKIYSSEKLFQSIFENAPEVIIVCEMETGMIISGNTLANDWFTNIDNIKNKRISEILIPSKADNQITLPLNKDQLNGVYSIDLTSKTHFVSASGIPIFFNNKPSLLFFLRDITPIMETSEALEKSEQKYRELTESLPQAVFEADQDFRFLYVNRYGLQTFGYTLEDLQKGISVLDIIAPEEIDNARENLKTIMEGGNPNNNFEYIALDKNGRRFPIMVHTNTVLSSNNVIGIRGTATDITERKKFEAELQRTDKLEALGILAGGIAHDFNNLLTAVWAGISLLRIKIQSDPESALILSDTETALKRGKELTGQLLTYSKGGTPIKVTTSLINIVKETASFTTTGTNVRCAFNFD
ncbi:MAG: PAS domain S-box protein, partial [Fibrobacter sp.]|nr:PAS domain S-box protein [Fibrobacter sp.]